MLSERIEEIRRHFQAVLRREFGVELPAFPVEVPPKPEFGDLALTFCMGLAKSLKKPPRQIAQTVIDKSGPIDGVSSLRIEGPGYINLVLDREALLKAVVNPRTPPQGKSGKIIVEHTNINPNKAAHIGHLRNAVLGDTLVRAQRSLGEAVEVQNYIDDTGVQVADVVVGFEQLRHLTLEQIRAIPEPFDYYCWDLYAETGRWYGEDEARLKIRQDTLLKIEHGEQPTAGIAAHVADRIVHCHLQTMRRIGATYDVLPRESAILHLRFWASAFELLKQHGAVYLQSEGKNQGCWVMKTEVETGGENPDDQEKVIVRSNGTVTYVGKDIAYQLWKVGKLGMDFHYRRFHAYPDGGQVWESCTTPGTEKAPAFGGGAWVYNVIDVRQSYLQNVVNQALRALGHAEAAARSVHFAYEMVALTPRCAETLGFQLSEEDRKRSHVDMSGRKGIGVKADDLMNLLIERSAKEVAARNPDMPAAEQRACAEAIAIGALRYFMLKFSETTVLAFDIDDALAFEGETGPYLQNAAVRARAILRKLDEAGIAYSPLAAPARNFAPLLGALEPAQWDLIMSLLRIETVTADAVQGLNLAAIAKHAFTLAQKFHAFYHDNPIKQEADPVKRELRILIVQLFLREMEALLAMLGVSIPSRM